VKILLFLFRSSRKVTLAIAALGLINGLSAAALIAVINAAIHRSDGFTALLIIGVLAVALTKVLTGIVAQWLLVKFSQDTLLRIGVDLCRTVLTAPLRRLEETGIHRILTALTNDVLVLGTAVQTVPALATNGAIMLGCGAYLAWLYPRGFLMMLLVLLMAILTFVLLNQAAFGAIVKAREKRDLLMRCYRSLTEGVKELKMNRARREEFIEKRVEPTAADVKRLNLFAARRYVFVDAWNQTVFYLMIGVALFMFPRDDPRSAEIVTGYIFSALYMMAPIWAIISSLGPFVQGQVSLAKLEELDVSLTKGHADSYAAPSAAVLSSPVLEFKGIEFEYKAATPDGYAFHLGPIEFTLHPGEVVFVVGGNGSGKSTFVKVLAGLYTPSAGQIVLSGKVIGTGDMDWLRQHFSVVFSDFHLFDGLLGATQPNVDELSAQYLDKLELGHKVKVIDRLFSTTELSTGQRKRLALLTALIEERPICIFDEWAADQDPHYKEVFYSQLLPELKAKGKAVVVVTHDDRYFGYGDRVVKLEDGQAARINAEHKARIAATVTALPRAGSE
jgi:putative pyoverdin transport system ATP-binding/permease protein